MAIYIIEMDSALVKVFSKLGMFTYKRKRIQASFNADKRILKLAATAGSYLGPHNRLLASNENPAVYEIGLLLLAV